MTDRPIIFSAPMVRALLDGRKSQTRRVLKPQPPFDGGNASGVCGDGPVSIAIYPGALGGGGGHYCKTPFAKGDRLYVREACTISTDNHHCDLSVAYPDCPVFYRATDDDEFTIPPRWRPSIHMPRWASRLTLTVTDVRVQRLQGISAADSIAEGIQCETCAAMGQSACHGAGCFASLVAFRVLWNSLHGPEAWDANPWVAAATFTVQHGNIDQIGGWS